VDCRRAYERSEILRYAADLMRARVADAACLTLVQGKSLVQARLEWGGAADLFDWFVEEGGVVPGA